MINKILGGFSKSDTKIMRKLLLSKFFFNFFHFFPSKIQLVSVHSCCARATFRRVGALDVFA